MMNMKGYSKDENPSTATGLDADLAQGNCTKPAITSWIRKGSIVVRRRY